MDSVYGGADAAEVKRLYVRKHYYKTHGLNILPNRIRIVHLVVATIRTLLRQLSPEEERGVLTYILNNPPAGRKRSKRRVRRQK